MGRGPGRSPGPRGGLVEDRPPGRLVEDRLPREGERGGVCGDSGYLDESDWNVKEVEATRANPPSGAAGRPRGEGGIDDLMPGATHIHPPCGG